MDGTFKGILILLAIVIAIVASVAIAYFSFTFKYQMFQFVLGILTGKSSEPAGQSDRPTTSPQQQQQPQTAEGGLPDISTY